MDSSIAFHFNQSRRTTMNSVDMFLWVAKKVFERNDDEDIYANMSYVDRPSPEEVHRMRQTKYKNRHNMGVVDYPKNGELDRLADDLNVSLLDSDIPECKICSGNGITTLRTVVEMCRDCTFSEETSSMFHDYLVGVAEAYSEAEVTTPVIITRIIDKLRSGTPTGCVHR